MRCLSSDLIRLRINELPFVSKIKIDVEVEICDYLASLDDDSLYMFERHTETPIGARKIRKFLLKKIGDSYVI